MKHLFLDEKKVWFDFTKQSDIQTKVFNLSNKTNYKEFFKKWMVLMNSILLISYLFEICKLCIVKLVMNQYILHPLKWKIKQISWHKLKGVSYRNKQKHSDGAQKIATFTLISSEILRNILDFKVFQLLQELSRPWFW